jgi:tetratricopeptide (TPR) repeat protein
MIKRKLKYNIEPVDLDDEIRKIYDAIADYNIILISGTIGSGKTTLAIEFANYYSKLSVESVKFLYTDLRPMHDLNEMIKEIVSQFEKFKTIQKHESEIFEIDSCHSKLTKYFWVIDSAEILEFELANTSSYQDKNLTKLSETITFAIDAGTKILICSRSETLSWISNSIMPVYLSGISNEGRESLFIKAAKNFNLTNYAPFIEQLPTIETNPLCIIFSAYFLSKMGNHIDYHSNFNPCKIDLNSDILNFVNQNFSQKIEKYFNDFEIKFLSLYLFGESNYIFLPIIYEFYSNVTENVDVTDRMIDYNVSKKILNKAHKFGLVSSLNENIYNCHPLLCIYLRKVFISTFKEQFVLIEKIYFETIINNFTLCVKRNLENVLDIFVVLGFYTDDIKKACKFILNDKKMNEIVGFLYDIEKLSFLCTESWDCGIFNHYFFEDRRFKCGIFNRNSYWGFFEKYNAVSLIETGNIKKAIKKLNKCLKWNAKNKKKTDFDNFLFTKKDMEKQKLFVLSTLAKIQHLFNDRSCEELYEKCYFLSIDNVNEKAVGFASTIFDVYLEQENENSINKCKLWKDKYKEHCSDKFNSDIIKMEGLILYKEYNLLESQGRPKNELHQIGINSIERLTNALASVSPIYNEETKFQIYNVLADLHFKMGIDFDKAIYYFRESIKICEEMNEFSSAGQLRIKIAMIYVERKMFKESLDYFWEAWDNYSKLGEEGEEMINYIKILMSYPMQQIDD